MDVSAECNDPRGTASKTSSIICDDVSSYTSEEPSTKSATKTEQPVTDTLKVPSNSTISVEVSRRIFTENDFQNDFERQENESDQPDRGIRHRIKKTCTSKSLWLLMCSSIPIINWLPKYKIKDYIIADFISGITVGISRIPMAMAYALLASLPPIYGLYVAFYPVLIYSIMGTSRHIAIGCEAVTAIMIAAVLDKVVDFELGAEGTYEKSTAATTQSPIDIEIGIRTEAATSLLLLVAMVQLGMFVLRLGVITTYFSDPLIRSFTTGACCHIFTSQFKELFGITIPRVHGYFELPKSYIEIFSRLGQCNPSALLIAVIAMVAMVVGSEILDYEAHKGTCRKKNEGKPRQRLLIPTDLAVVILATVASTFGNYNEKYGVPVIGNLPTGLPAPTIPSKDYFQIVLPDIFAIAIVGFAISFSAGKVYAKKYKYDINANQELLAYSTAGLISSFFHCYPFSTSLGRSGIQEGAGGKSQVAALVSCGMILLTVYYLAPLLSQLPKCVLAVMIILAMRGIFRQFADLPKLWRISLVDFLIWIVTWLSVVLLGVHIGLYFGVIFSLFSVIVKTQNPYAALLVRVEGTEIYRDKNAIKQGAEELPGIKIFRFYASLCFVNAECFKKTLYSKVGLDPRKKIRNTVQDEKSYEQEGKSGNSVAVHTIIIDCSMLAFIDVDGMQTLQTIVTECEGLNVKVFFSNANANVQNTLLNSDKLNSIYRIQLNEMYVTLHDAVEQALSNGKRLTSHLKARQDDLISRSIDSSVVHETCNDENNSIRAHFGEDETPAQTNHAYVVEEEYKEPRIKDEDTKF